MGSLRLQPRGCASLQRLKHIQRRFLIFCRHRTNSLPGKCGKLSSSVARESSEATVQLITAWAAKKRRAPPTGQPRTIQLRAARWSTPRRPRQTRDLGEPGGRPRTASRQRLMPAHIPNSVYRSVYGSSESVFDRWHGIQTKLKDGTGGDTEFKHGNNWASTNIGQTRGLMLLRASPALEQRDSQDRFSQRSARGWGWRRFMTCRLHVRVCMHLLSHGFTKTCTNREDIRTIIARTVTAPCIGMARPKRRSPLKVLTSSV